MRADLNERLEANIRVQLLVARLTLQEQRTSVVVRQLATSRRRCGRTNRRRCRWGLSRRCSAFSTPSREDEETSSRHVKAQFEQWPRPKRTSSNSTRS